MPKSTIKKTYAWNSPEMRELIKSALRKAFKRTPQFQRVMRAARREFPVFRKDGSLSKKLSVKYECAECKNLFPQKWVQVDHIATVVPLDKETIHMSIEDLAKGIICDDSNLQVLCSVPIVDNGGVPSCHRFKCNLERYIRDRIKELKLNNQFGKLTEDLLKQLTLDYSKYLIDKQLKEIEKKTKKGKKL